MCRRRRATCPAGTHAGADGKTCVADETPDQRKVEAPKPCPEGMALVKGGTYKMAFLKTEATVGDVCLDVTEATTKSYESCVTSGSCNANFVDACTETTTYKKPGKEDHPMVCIDFTQAEAYCKFQGKRLPTEEEWEWAARGGAEGRQYSWGNDAPADQVCWSGKSPRTGTCPVNAHPGTATPDGLLGMSGNVFEWTVSRNDSKGKDRVGRGGSWRDGLANLLLTGRPGRFEVTYRCGFLGVRCAVEPKPGK
ncbi:MAG: SUMF1/EgtB/PvdO family nonheme iron enzyme [Polyangiaceae bacterium]